MTTMTWGDLVKAAGPSARREFEWMWQDLDGLHLGPLPPESPPTSILWGWPQPQPGQQPAVSELWRVRLDGTTVYAASPASGHPHRTLPWGNLDQVAQMRCADGALASEVRQMVWVEVVEDLPPDGSPALTFYYRVLE